MSVRDQPYFLQRFLPVWIAPQVGFLRALAQIEHSNSTVSRSRAEDI